MNPTYYALVDGFIEGVYRKAGQPVGRLSERQAKYLLLAGTISLEKPSAAAGKAKAE